MRWILIDLALALLALGVLAVLGLGLWRKVKALSRTVGEAGKAVATATDALALAQGDGPLGQAARPAPPAVPGRSPARRG